MDLSHGLPFTHPMDIRAGDYDDVADCALVIVTAGAGQKPGRPGWIWCTRMWPFSGVSSRRSPGAIGTPSCSSCPIPWTCSPGRRGSCPATRPTGCWARARCWTPPGSSTCWGAPGGGQPQRPRLHHRRARGQRAGGVEQGQRVRHLPGSLLRAAGLLRARQGRRVAPAGGAGQRL